MGQLLGRQWQPRDIAALCYQAGWRDAADLTTAVAVCLAESQGYDQAVNQNPDGTIDRGIWQLNSIHKAVTDAIAYDPVQATPVAYSMWRNRGGFGDWAAFNGHVYLRDTYIKRAARGTGNFLADQLLNRQPTDTLSGQPYRHSLAQPVLDFDYRVVALLDLCHTAAGLLKVGKAVEARAKLLTAPGLAKS